MCAKSNPHLSLPPDLAPCMTQVAGFHRAVPSTALDKAFMQLPEYFTRKPEKVNPQFDILSAKGLQIRYRLFCSQLIK